MKKILITGINSYIGNSFDEYIKSNYPEEIVCHKISLKDASWRDTDFSSYDSILHVAGIAHSDNGKISKEKEELYYKVNTELSYEVAKKAKDQGVKQFIYMSSAIVYGKSAKIGKQKVIGIDTPVSPLNCYGDSKVQGENKIKPLSDESFKVLILRPPMIYGKGCKGNYQTLSKMAAKLPFFPYVKNQRSMLYVENLCEFIYLMIKNNESGTFFPQNKELTNTSEMVKMIAKAKGKNIRLVKGFTWLIKFMGLFTGLVNKAFGNLCYEESLGEYKEEYRKYSLSQSVERTEK